VASRTFPQTASFALFTDYDPILVRLQTVRLFTAGLGARLGTTTIPVSRKGYRELEIWARSFGCVRAFGIEGTGSYGAGLSRALVAQKDTPSSR
jgi:hypothetical protein